MHHHPERRSRQFDPMTGVRRSNDDILSQTIEVWPQPVEGDMWRRSDEYHSATMAEGVCFRGGSGRFSEPEMLETGIDYFWRVS
jgi:hypothetical protein